MNPEDLLYEAYASTFDSPYNSQEFSTMLKSDGEFVNEVFGTLYNYSDEVRATIDDMLAGKVNLGGQSAVEGGKTYEEKEVVENPQPFVPKTVNGEIDYDYYDEMGSAFKEKQDFDNWLKDHPEAQREKDKLNTVEDVNQALIEPIAAPSYDNQIATIVEYDEYKRGDYLPADNYSGDILAPGTDAQEEIDKREAAEFQERPEEVEYLDQQEDGAFVTKSRKETVQEFQDRLEEENVFGVEFFTPDKASGDDYGAEGFRLAFQGSLPEGYKIWTPNNSYTDGRYTMEMLEAMERSGTKIPDEVKKLKQRGVKDFVVVQDPRGNVHEVKSLFEPGTYSQSPKAAQKAFIKFLGASLDDSTLQDIKNTTAQQQDSVDELFKDALDLSFNQGDINKYKNYLLALNKGKKSGVLGLSVDDRVSIQEKVNNISFTPRKESYEGEDRNIEYLVQPYEKELKEALQQLNISDATNGVKREEPLTIKSKEVQDLTRENLKLKIERDTKDGKYEKYIQGDADVDTVLNKDLIRKYTSISKLKSVNKAEKANYLVEKSTRSVNNFIAKGTDNIKELNNFVDDSTIVYNIKPGEKAYQMKDGRLVPAALFDNAQKEKSILGSKIQFSKDQQNNFFNQVAKMNDSEEQWDVVKRNYNDGAKFFSQLATNSADLLINVGYGASKLLEVTNPAVWMLKGMGVDSRTVLDNIMMSWQNYKEDVSEEYKRDQQFGEIKDLADVGEYALQSVASQLPIILSMIATGGLSVAAGEAAGLTAAQLTRLSTIASSSLVGLSSFGGKVSDMNYEEFKAGKDLYSDAEILTKGFMYGVVEGGLAAVSTAPLLNKGLKIKGLKMSRAVTDKAEEMGRRAFVKNYLTKEILPETLTEMGAEGLTTGLQNLIDGRPFLENMTETLVTAGIWGAGMSGMPGAVAFGRREFANRKELGIIKKANKDVSDYSMKINNLINQKNNRKGSGLAPDIDINKEIDKYIKLREQAQNTIIEADNQIKQNLNDKGISATQYVGQYTEGLKRMADLRSQAESVVNDKTLSVDEKNKQLDALDKEYRETEFYRDVFTDTKTFGDGYAAMAMAAQGSSPFSKARTEFNKTKAEAVVNIRKKKGENYNPTRDEIVEAGRDIVKRREIKEQVKKDKTWSNKNDIKYEAFETAVEANTYINDQYNKLIEKEQKAGNDSEVKKLRQEKQQLMNKVSSKETLLGGFNDPRIGAVAIVDNMAATGLTKTGVHEITHELTDKLIANNSSGFNLMADQIVQYLEYTKQGEVLIKMQADNANLTRLYKDANGEVIGSLTNKGYNASELVSSFMENLDKIDLTKMDNQIAVLGALLNVGLKAATDGSYDIKFSGQEEILNYFKGLGDAIKSKSPTMSMAASQTSFSQTDSKLFTKVDDVFKSDESLKNKGLEIGNLYRNFVTARLNKGFEVGKLKIRPRDFSGFNDTILEDVVSDMATGGSGIPGLVKSWSNRDMTRFGDISLPKWINARLNQRILGYLPNDLVRNDMSIDSETARQIEDIKASKFDVDVTSARRGVVPESEAREIKPVEDLKIITPELVDEVKDIITKTLKRTALTQGISKETVLADLNKAVDKEMTKVIKSKMGPITRSVLGFAPKQYIDFIKDEMMTIVGSMPTNLIKQKAKSKAWAEVFKLEEIGREDIKKVSPEGKVTNYRKQIFKLEKPDPQKFQRYFTRGGYTTLIERQRSLIKPMAQQLTRSEISRLRQDKNFLQDLADRTGMTDVQVTEFFVDNVIEDIQSELDNTASEILQQDTVKFSDTLASSSPQSRQTFIDGLNNPTFRKMLADNIANSKYLNKAGKTSALRVAIDSYFDESQFDDLTQEQISQIARDFGGLTKTVFQKQFVAESKVLNEQQLANLIAESIESKIENQADYKEIELAQGITEVDFDPRSLTSVNQGRAMVKKLAKLVGREKFIRLFAPGLAGPGGLAGLMVTQPKGNQITDSEMVGLLPKKGEIGGKAVQKQNSNIITYSGTKSQVDTMSKLLNFRNIEFTTKNGKLIIPEISGSSKNANISTISKYAREGGRQGSGLYLNMQDLEQNVIYAKDQKGNFIVGPSKGDYGTVTNKGRYDNRATSKNWFKSKKFQDLNTSGKLKEMNDIKDVGDVNKSLFRDTVMDLAGKLTPTEARWFVSVNSADMTGGIKASASLIGIPYLDPKELAKALNLSPNDQYVLEHMTPAKYMALLTYKFLLDPSASNATKFNVELDNFNTMILPKGVDNILFAEGLGSDMGLKHQVGKDPFETRYKKVLKTMQILKTDGEVIGTDTRRFSETNNSPKTKEFNSELVNSSKVIETNPDQNSGISVIETEILDKALSIARDPNAPIKKIRVFDFDDTLARSDSKVFAIKGDQRIEMSAERFASEGSSMLEDGFTFDFSDFNIVRGGKPGPMLEVAKKIQAARGTEDVFVLTARAPESQPAIKQFLEGVGLDVPLENITGLGKSSEFAKSSWIVNKAAEGYNDFYFTDDAIQNVRAVKSALDLMDVKSKTQLVKENTVKFSETGGKKLDWKTDEAGNINTTFNAGNKKYNFSLDSRDSKGSFDVDFNLNGRRDLTGTGNSVTVIKTVYNGLLDAIDQNKNIKRIEFSADQAEPSRVKLYTTLANRISNKLGWELDVYETKSFIGGTNSFDFELTKPSPIFRALDVVDIKSPAQQSKIKFSETVDQSMNDIIYQKTGIESFKEYSDVRAKSEGRDKRSFDLIPASAEDFGGLLYNLLGKGSVGDAQWEWMQDNLIKPYNRGINDLTVAQNTLAADFKALKNSLEGIPKNLKKKAFGGFTFEDIVRIDAWNKQDIKVEGLSKRDLKQVDDFVKENPEIGIFSSQLIDINKSNGYYYPGKNWLAGTITTDMREGLRTQGRSKYLAQWNENIDQAFSNKNLNKIEAAFGSKYREALEDSIRRMKTGTNRGVAMGRIESRFLDYVNNSIGGVMFLNARSAVLQTISSLNFIELTGDNNLYKAGKAFANQPQYWSDFMTLMNSDYLVDRRNGLKINVSESEIAESAKTSTNKAKAVIATLLKKGFVLTQIADSFAIATGGASYYRNKVNAYLKQGLSKADAEARAFEDFKAKSEESQQSSDPSKISQQQASTAGKVILAFANTPSQYSRIMKKAGLDLVNGRGDWKDNVSKILYYGALQNIIFTTLQSALFAVAFNDDDEEQKSFLEKYKGVKTLNSMTDNVLRGLGIGGAVVSTIKNIALDIYDRSKKSRPEYPDVAFKLLDVSPPIDIKVSKFKQGMTTWEYGRKDPEAKDPFNINNPAYEAAAKVVASTTNVPLDRIYQKVENIKGALNDDNENWKRLAMGLGWPEWQLMSEKEKEEDRKERALKRKEAKTRKYAYKPVLDEAGYKNQKIKQDTEKYFKLTKQEQIQKLDSLGLTKSNIKALKYEKDRVDKLLQLMEE